MKLLTYLLPSYFFTNHSNLSRGMKSVVYLSKNKIAVIAFCLFIPLVVMGQGKVVRPKDSLKERPTDNKTTKRSQIIHKKTFPISVSLACDFDGTRKYYTEKEWKGLSKEEKVRLNKVGLVVKSGNEKFLMSLKELPNFSNWETAKARTDNQTPIKEQWQIIKQNKDRINEALYAYGGGCISSRRWWNSGSTPSWTVMFYDGTEYDHAYPSKDKAGVWLATNDVENGFREVTISKSVEQSYDFVGEESFSKLRVVRHNAKYGVINHRGDIVVPIKFDELGCDWQYHMSGNDKLTWDYSVLMSVSQNGNWGYVNRQGNLVTPLIFDRVQTSSGEKNTPIWVSKNGLYGCIDTLGNYVIPVIYEDEIHFYSYNNSPARTKKNGKWGFIRQNGEVAVQFKYDFARDFCDGLARVSLNNKYGFINCVGDVVIPVKYEFADDFSSGLAGVVVNGKLGYINVRGNIVIPCIYDVDLCNITYSSGEHGKCLGTGMSFYSDVAFVKRNDKYAMINKQGRLITKFKYDRLSSASSSGYFTAHIGEKTVYLDRGGNEYFSIQERSEKSDSVLANQGYPYQQFKIGKKEYEQKNYTKAYPWFVKSVEGGDDHAQCHLGYYYYYGYEPVKKDRAEAFRLFSLAAEQNNHDACYFLG